MANMHLVTGHAGLNHVTAADHASMNAALIGAGEYVLDRGNKFAATIISNNIIRIADGDIVMQGRHIRMNEGSYVDLTIENGTQDMLRHDLIVCRYTMDSQSGIVEANLVVIKGTAAASNPQDPEYTVGDILTDHAFQADMPLYRVILNGLTVQPLVALFSEYTPAGDAIAAAASAAANAQSTADNAQTAASKAQSTANTASTTANAAMPKAGGTFTGTAVAGGTQTETNAEIRNAVILPSGTTDFSSVPNNTIILVKE